MSTIGRMIRQNFSQGFVQSLARCLVILSLITFIVAVVGCKDPACVTKIEKTLPMKAVQNSKHLLLAMDSVDFLNDSTIEWENIELTVTLKGKHTLQEKIWLSMNGIKVARKDGRRNLESMDYNKRKDLSVSKFNLQLLFMNGAEPFYNFLGKIKKNDGQLNIAFYGKNLEIVEATITFVGKSHLKCSPPKPTPTPAPTPTPTPPPVQTNIDSVVPAKLKTSSTSILFNFSSPTEGAIFSCSLDGSLATACTSPKSYSGLGNGLHSFQVFAQSPQGVIDLTPATHTWTVSTVAPSVTITNAAQLPGLSKENSIHFEFTSDKEGSTFKCSLDGAVSVTCSSPVSYSALAEGTHLFAVNATDSDGNVGTAPATFQWVLDMTLPEASFIDVVPAEEVSSATYKNFTFLASESSSFQCSLNGGPFANCVSPVAIDSLSEGSYVFAVRADDAAGNRGLPVTYSWTVDFTKPVIELGVVMPSAGLTNADEISVEFSVNESADTFCRLDDQAAVPCTSPYKVVGLSEGEHRVEISATDTAGNSSDALGVAWIMDRTAPVISFGEILPSAARVVSSSDLSLTINVADGVQLMASLNGEASGAVSNPIMLSALSEGEYTVSVSAVDEAGNMSNIIDHSFVVDRTGPSLTIAAQNSHNPSNADHNTFSFGTSEEVLFECNMDGAGFATCVSPSEYSGLAEGAHIFQVRAVDVAGNLSAISEYAWSIDTTPPTTSINANVNEDTAQFSMSSNEASATFRCSLDGTEISTCDEQMTFSNLSIGSHSFVAKAKDSAGNIDPAGATFQFVVSKPIHTLLTSKSPPGTITTSTSIGFTFQADQTDATFRCSLDNSPLMPCASPISYFNLADGNHNFVVKAVDMFGTMDPVGATHTWTVDTTGPVVSNIITTTTNNSISITWLTDEPSMTQVRYGLGASLNQMTEEVTELTTTHSVVLTGLAANTTYSLQILTRDALGNSGSSPSRTARTAR